ncbi:BQ5605_C002g01157 [Microbotryum silenes-dioicae]|uniref:BQ5605_C002g01157 protein n=1 Tax=Microbotryum silenes-dioicae TaxID=796604 RepID=A0A2X0MSS2_9BASI|nr:BQ5605_C002g01157 [Microbotryum silenes-dioicae]
MTETAPEAYDVNTREIGRPKTRCSSFTRDRHSVYSALREGFEYMQPEVVIYGMCIEYSSFVVDSAQEERVSFRVLGTRLRPLWGRVVALHWMLNHTDLPWNGERTSEDVISRRVRSPPSPVPAVFTMRTKRPGGAICLARAIHSFTVEFSHVGGLRTDFRPVSTARKTANTRMNFTLILIGSFD